MNENSCWRFVALWSVVIFTLSMGESGAAETSDWQGYARQDFMVDDRKAWLVAPKSVAPGRPWIWRARFFGHEPQVDLALLESGYHLAYCDVSNYYASPRALAVADAFYRVLTEEHDLAEKVALEGMSRGGAFIYNFAAKYPERVAVMYADAPVCDLRSWPLGSGRGKGSPGSWQGVLHAYGLSEAEMMEEAQQPLATDRLRALAEAGVPILHVIGEADEIVPVEENSDVVEKRYRQQGGLIEVIRKPGIGHHPHCLEDPSPIVDFIRRHVEAAVSGEGLKRSVAVRDGRPIQGLVERAKATRQTRLAFLGGSITEMDGYRPMVTQGVQQWLGDGIDVHEINAGVASTCSRTGAFRLANDVLSEGEIDCLFVEYAVNDDQDAAHTTEAALRGLEGIVRHVRRQQPHAAIVVTHFINPGMLKQWQAGEVPLSVKAHERVAEHYGLTSIFLAKEVAQRIDEGRLTWKQFGGTHPEPVGNRLAARLIMEALSMALDETAIGSRVTNLPTPLDEDSYATGAFLGADRIERGAGWEVRTPDWLNLEGSCRGRFRDAKLWCAPKAGATLKIPFKGSAIGAYLLAGPDAGVVEFRIDGGAVHEVDLYHRFSRNLHYPRTVMFASNLSEGAHTLELSSGHRKEGPGGDAVRILHFVANERD